MRKIIIKTCSDCREKFFTEEDLPWRKGDSLCKGCRAKKELEKIFSDWKNYFDPLPENLSATICLVAEMREKSEKLKNDMDNLLAEIAVPDSVQEACNLLHDNLLRGAEKKMANFYEYELKEFICVEKNRETIELIKNLPLIQKFPEVLREIKERFTSKCHLLSADSSENELRVWSWDVSYRRERKGRVEIRIGYVDRIERGRDSSKIAHSGDYFSLCIDGGQGCGTFFDDLSTKQAEDELHKLGLKSYRQLQGRKVYYQLSGNLGKLLEII